VAEPKKPGRRVPSNPYSPPSQGKVDVTQPVTSPVRRGAPETTRPVGRTDLVTEGMKAHRREIERRKRQKALEKLQIEEQSADTRRKIWKWTAWVVFLLAAGFGYQWLQETYGNQWSIWYVWLLLGAALFGSIGWMLWYFNRPEM
jgi:hypothetical protein